MSSFADNKNVSESKQQQQQQQQLAKETLQTTTQQQFVDENRDTNKSSESTTKSETTFNRKAIIPTTKLTIRENKTRNVDSATSIYLNKNTDAGTADPTPRSPLTVHADCGSKMPPGDTEQQVECDIRQVVHIEKDNQQQQNSVKSRPPNEGALAYQIKSIGGVAISSEASTPTTASSPLPPLPPGFNSAFGTHLPHISSEPTFGVQLRKKQQQENSTNEDLDNSEFNYSASSGIKAGTVSASASPNMVRKSSDGSVVLPRRVSFPKSDNELVTGYLEPANPWVHGEFLLKCIYLFAIHFCNTRP